MKKIGNLEREILTPELIADGVFRPRNFTHNSWQIELKFSTSRS